MLRFGLLLLEMLTNYMTKKLRSIKGRHYFQQYITFTPLTDSQLYSCSSLFHMAFCLTDKNEVTRIFPRLGISMSDVHGMMLMFFVFSFFITSVIFKLGTQEPIKRWKYDTKCQFLLYKSEVYSFFRWDRLREMRSIVLHQRSSISSWHVYVYMERV